VIRRLVTASLSLVILITDGAVARPLGWALLVSETPLGAWSPGQRFPLPHALEVGRRAEPVAVRTHAGSWVWPDPDTRLVLDRRGVRLSRGGAVVQAGRRAVRVSAEGSTVVVLRGHVRVRRDVGGGVLLLVQEGQLLFEGRTHRAGAALRWRPQRRPTLRPWPRGSRVARSCGGETPRFDGAPGPALPQVLFHEWRFRRQLLRVCAEGHVRHRWLALALVLETGTPVQRAAAAGLARGVEVRRLLHVLRAARHDADERVRRAARSALARRHHRMAEPVSGDLLKDPRVVRMVRHREMLRARFDAVIARGGGGPLIELSRWPGFQVLDRVVGELRSAPDAAVPGRLRILEQVLGREVSQEARARLSDRRAALLLAQTVGRAFQPPGEGLLLP